MTAARDRGAYSISSTILLALINLDPLSVKLGVSHAEQF